MNISLIPSRWQLLASELAAAFAEAGLTPTDRAGLPELPAPPADPAKKLAKTDLLDGKRRLSAEATAMLSVLADPARVYVFVVNHAGSKFWRETTVFRGDGDAEEGPFVSLSFDGKKCDVALLPTAEFATIAFEEFCGFTLIESDPGQTYALKLPEFAALLAGADLLEETRLENQISRNPGKPPTLSAIKLEAALSNGLSSTDTRWAVTAGGQVCPVDLSGAIRSLSAGLDGLASLGLIERSGNRRNLTGEGYAVMASLAQILVTSGVSMGTMAETGKIAVGHVNFFRCTTALWAAVWTDVSESGAAVEITRISPASAMAFLHHLLEPRERPPESNSKSPVKKKAAPAKKKKLAPPRKKKTAAAPRPGARKRSKFCRHCGGEKCATKKFCVTTGQPM